MRRRTRLPRLMGIVPLGILLLTGCTGSGSGDPGRSAAALPTGLVGAVAPTAGPDALRYVALGDGYTFGDGVLQADRWTNQLVRILRPELDLDIVANLAGRSTTTREVIDDQLPRLVELEPEFVSIQVGVNDVGSLTSPRTSPGTYSRNISEILDTVLDENVRADRIIVLTTPDFTLTPGGPALVEDPAATRALIEQFNMLLRDAATARGIAVVDVSSISDRVPRDPNLVAPDGLHPSGKQYAGWADLVAETVRRLFRDIVASGDPSPGIATGVPSASVAP